MTQENSKNPLPWVLHNNQMRSYWHEFKIPVKMFVSPYKHLVWMFNEEQGVHSSNGVSRDVFILLLGMELNIQIVRGVDLLRPNNDPKNVTTKSSRRWIWVPYKAISRPRNNNWVVTHCHSNWKSPSLYRFSLMRGVLACVWSPNWYSRFEVLGELRASK